MEQIVCEFLEYLKIPISKKHCKNLIQSHPDYPSLLSIADVLERLGIEYNLFQIEKSKLDDLTFPYLLHVDKNGGEMLFISNKKDLNFYKKDIEDWRGIVLEAATTDKIKDRVNNKEVIQENQNRKLSLLLLATIAVFLIITLMKAPNFLNSSLIITSLLGILVGYLLIAKDLGVKYNSVERFCNSGKKSNCDKVLNSKEAKLFRVFKFSDAVYSYFSFMLIVLVFNSWVDDSFNSGLILLTISNLFAVPFIVFSIYHQNFVAKAWCKLCLIIDGILIVQGCFLGYWFIADNFSVYEVNVLVFVLLLLIFPVIAISTVLVKNKIEEGNMQSQLANAANRIKYSAVTFSTLLLQQKRVSVEMFEAEILMGNPKAPISIIMVSNLYCNPCKEQHEKLSELLSTYKDKVSVAIRFILSGKDIGNKPTSNQYIIRYWLENYFKKENESANTEKLLHDWYKLMDPEKFKVKYPLENRYNLQGDEIERNHYKWIDAGAVYSTPTFFVNGFQFPKDYNLSDMLSLVPGLVESFANNSLQENIVAPT